jgi:hypothetical protein
MIGMLLQYADHPSVQAMCTNMYDMVFFEESSQEVYRKFFADLLTYLLGFVLVLGGVQQIASLLVARKWSQVSTGFYVMPVLILLAGLLALFNPGGVRSTAFIIIGVAAIVYALTDLLNWYRFMRHRPKEAVVVVEDAVVVDEVHDVVAEEQPKESL